MKKIHANTVHKLGLLLMAGLLMGCDNDEKRDQFNTKLSPGGVYDMSEKLANSEAAATDLAQTTAQNAALDSAENATSGPSNTARTPLPHEIPHV